MLVIEKIRMLYAVCYKQLISVYNVDSEIRSHSFAAPVSYEESPSHDSIDRHRVAYAHGALQSLSVPPSGWVRNDVFEGGECWGRLQPGCALPPIAVLHPRSATDREATGKAFFASTHDARFDH